MSNNIVLGLSSTYKGEHAIFGFVLVWFLFFRKDQAGSITRKGEKEIC
jgi:hypothetical protein